MQTPHKCIVLLTEAPASDTQYEADDWKNFDWTKFKNLSSQVIRDLTTDWASSDSSFEDWALSLQTALINLQEEIMTKRRINKHSRPWFCPEVKKILADLKRARNKMKRHKSQSNIDEFIQAKEEASTKIQKAKDKWVMNVCRGIQNLSDSEKWKVINKLTGDSTSTCVQPIKNENGEYLFKDEEILKVMEEYHILKTTQTSNLLTNSTNQPSSSPNINNIATSPANAGSSMSPTSNGAGRIEAEESNLTSIEAIVADTVSDLVASSVERVTTNAPPARNDNSETVESRNQTEASNRDSVPRVFDAEITEHEILSTFGTSMGAPGPDGVPGKLLDGADRTEMKKALKMIYQKAWSEGKFGKAWKQEHRPVIPKPGKDSYNDSQAYRTISLTSVIGKRFEKITCNRLMRFLLYNDFDQSQFAYLQGRSTTQALILLLEEIATAMEDGKQVGVAFFDFTDAFGMVDRDVLLQTVKDLGIRGRLLNHITDFLSERNARIKINSLIGEWLPSALGTSAGTILGPVLFIMHIHNAPACIKPKYADDFSAIATGNSVEEVERKLQSHVDRTVEWCDERKMQLNVSKTKIMLFSSSNDTASINIQIEGKQVEQVRQIKHLGVMLDPKLNGKLQVEFACSKALRAMAKTGSLMKGRHGVNIELGLQLFLSLVRPHLENALPAWAFMIRNRMDELEKTQVKCIRKVMGQHARATSEGIQVASGVLPFRFRTKELCVREYFRTLEKPMSNPIRKSMPPIWKGLKSPLGFLRYESRDATKEFTKLNCAVSIKKANHPDKILEAESPDETSAISFIAGNANSRTKQQMSQAKREVETFIQIHNPNSVFAFTDGSIKNRGGSLPETVGFGACAAVITEDNTVIAKEAREVGNITENVECELEGIVLALELLVKLIEDRQLSPTNLYVLTDCKAAIQIARSQNNSKHLAPREKIWTSVKKIHNANSTIHLVWCPGHCGIRFNEEADQLAKSKASEVANSFSSNVGASKDAITSTTANKIILKQAIGQWQSSWDRQANHAGIGIETHSLIPKVGGKLIWSKKRSTDISLARMICNSTNLLDHKFKMGLSDTATCDCNMARETVMHYLLECPIHQVSRDVLDIRIQEIWEECNRAGNLSISKELLLSSKGSPKITKEMNTEVKSALFQFIESTGKLL